MQISKNIRDIQEHQDMWIVDVGDKWNIYTNTI